jgi:hypothetical protein
MASVNVPSKTQIDAGRLCKTIETSPTCLDPNERVQLSRIRGEPAFRGNNMSKLALLLAIALAATSPSLAFAAKKHHHHHKTMTAEPADPNADTTHLIHDLFLGK